MFKVRCRHIVFDGVEEMFPCHLNYKIGDKFYYDGVYFTGRICPELFSSRMPVIHNIHLMGHGFSRNIPYKYRLDVRNPDMARYDGEGFSPRKSLPDSEPLSKSQLHSGFSQTETLKGVAFACSDTRTPAQFVCEAVDLSDSEYCQPFYRRALAILNAIRTEHGIARAEILERFTLFERDDMSPMLIHPFLDVMLRALTEMNYIKLENNGVHVTGKLPESGAAESTGTKDKKAKTERRGDT
jgi:uncharacterized repeat protein (TIGR04076 family)